MITRRGFFGTVAALVVGGAAARLRLTAPAAVGLIGGINRSMFPWWRVPVPTPSRTLLETELRALRERLR